MSYCPYQTVLKFFPLLKNLNLSTLPKFKSKNRTSILITHNTSLNCSLLQNI